MIALLAGFLMGFVGSMPIAGPVSSLVFHRGMAGRDWDGWAIGVGGAFAEGMYCAVAVHGISVLRATVTPLAPLAEGLGPLLLLLVGLYLIAVKHRNPRENQATNPSGANWGSEFAIGLGLSAVNPTAILTWSAAVSTLYAATGLRFSGAEQTGFAAAAALGIVAWFSVLLVLLRRFRPYLTLAVHRAALRCIGGALILLSIVSLTRWAT